MKALTKVQKSVLADIAATGTTGSKGTMDHWHRETVGATIAVLLERGLVRKEHYDDNGSIKSILFAVDKQ